jgi:hypothetical protein
VRVQLDLDAVADSLGGDAFDVVLRDEQLGKGALQPVVTADVHRGRPGPQDIVPAYREPPYARRVRHHGDAPEILEEAILDGHTVAFVDSDPIDMRSSRTEPKVSDDDVAGSDIEHVAVPFGVDEAWSLARVLGANHEGCLERSAAADCARSGIVPGVKDELLAGTEGVQDRAPMGVRTDLGGCAVTRPSRRHRGNREDRGCDHGPPASSCGHVTHRPAPGRATWPATSEISARTVPSWHHQA